MRQAQQSPSGRVHPEQVAMRTLARIFAQPRRYERAQRMARVGQTLFVRGGIIERLPGPLSGWTAMRDLTPVPAQSFRDWWRARKPEKEEQL